MKPQSHSSGLTGASLASINSVQFFATCSSCSCPVVAFDRPLSQYVASAGTSMCLSASCVHQSQEGQCTATAIGVHQHRHLA
eukprot:731417-Amphidinium_carterae.1